MSRSSTIAYAARVLLEVAEEDLVEVREVNLFTSSSLYPPPCRAPEVVAVVHDPTQRTRLADRLGLTEVEVFPSHGPGQLVAYTGDYAGARVQVIGRVPATPPKSPPDVPMFAAAT